MSTRKLVCCLAIALMVLSAAPMLAQRTVASVDSETIPGTFDKEARAAEQARQAAWLTAREGRSRLQPAVAELTDADRETLANARTDQGRMLVGVTKDLGLPIATSNEPGMFGRVRSDRSGQIWMGAVQSPGATALRLHISNFNLPDDAELWIYNRQGQAFGPYTGNGPNNNGELWTNTIFGDEVRVQLQFPEGAFRATRKQMVIEQVLHLGDNFLLGRMAQAEDDDKAFCSFNASCVQNASCSTVPSAIAANANGVGHMQFVIGSSGYICTGSLLNDTNSSTTVPLFLTANHCLSTQTVANSLEAFFQFTTSCGGSCTLGGSVPSTNGSTLLATNSTSDYTLLQLSGSLPSGSVLMGWTTTAVANSNGTQLYRLSHPKGSPQAYSEQQVNTSAGTCSGIPRGAWIYSRHNLGATEGGSSGSGVVNSSGQVVGQLTGACGTNTGNSCDSTNNAVIDGALASYYSSVSQWLDPTTGGGGCHVGSIGTANYCSASCPCDDGEGDCDSNSECVSGTTCVSNVGPNYGWASWVDVCEGSSGGGPNSCVGNCGSQASGGCWCDSSCSFYGDCCSDKVAVCG